MIYGKDSMVSFGSTNIFGDGCTQSNIGSAIIGCEGVSATAGNASFTPGGTITKVGNSYYTPKGTYTLCGSSLLGPSGSWSGISSDDEARAVIVHDLNRR